MNKARNAYTDFTRIWLPCSSNVRLWLPSMVEWHHTEMAENKGFYGAAGQD